MNRKRRTYLVDLKLQLPLALHVLGVMIGVAALYVVALFVLPSEGSLKEMDAEETRDLLLRANLIYFTLATLILFTVTLLLTHRIAGPARVIEEAVKAAAAGDFDHRLNLRRRDYLKSLAAAVQRMHEELSKREEERRAVLRDLDRCLRERDHAGALELLARLGAESSSETAAASAS